MAHRLQNDFVSFARLVDEAIQSKPDDGSLLKLKAQTKDVLDAVQAYKDAVANQQKAEVQAAQLGKQANEYRTVDSRTPDFKASEWRSQARRIQSEANAATQKSIPQAKEAILKLQQIFSEQTVIAIESDR